MRFTPSEKLTEKQVNTGLNLIVKDGLMVEAMATLTGGAFLVALAIKLGASNFQIGLLAALPTISPVFQLVGIYLVQRFANRRAITVISSILARGPLILISILPFIFSPQLSLIFIIGLLFFHYFFGSVSGCSWNSWMKDLVPDDQLGRYFSNRSRLIQILSVTLSFIVAFVLDYVKGNIPAFEVKAYSIMFLIGGVMGVLGVSLLARTPEPRMEPVQSNLFKLLKKPLADGNFRNMIVFNACWAFAINLAAPFFSVYLLKMLNLPLSYVVSFNILSQITNILFIRVWGRYSDKFGNKSILRICAPVYLFCILGWTFTTMPEAHMLTIPLLIVIYIFNGISVAGINLAISNVGIKLAPKKADAAVYLTARAMIVAAVAGSAPLVGGLFADFFSTRELSWNIEWKSPTGNLVFHTLELQQWDFFFVFAFIFGLYSLYRLSFVKEAGVENDKVIMSELMYELRNEVKMQSNVAGLKNMIHIPFSFFSVLKRKRQIEKYRRRKRKGGYYSLKKNNFEGRKFLKRAG